MKAVARIWAGRRGGGQSTAGDPLTEAAADQLRARFGFSDDEIFIDVSDEPVIRLFYSMATQWRFDPLSGRRLGIDYSAVPATAQMLGVQMSPDRFHDMRVMEAEALNVLARR